MKQSLISIFISVFISSIITFLFVRNLSNNQVAFVDSAKIINEYIGMKLAREAFQKKASVWKANIDTLAQEVRGQMKKVEDAKRGSARELTLAQQLHETKQKQLNEYQEAANTNAAKEDAELTRNVINEINAYISDYGKKNNYRIILASTEYGNIAYGDEVIDLTQEIIRGLNKKYETK